MNVFRIQFSKNAIINTHAISSLVHHTLVTQKTRFRHYYMNAIEMKSK